MRDQFNDRINYKGESATASASSTQAVIRIIALATAMLAFSGATVRAQSISYPNGTTSLGYTVSWSSLGALYNQAYWLDKSEATYSGSCGSFGAWTNVYEFTSPTTGSWTSPVEVVQYQKCYKYRITYYAAPSGNLQIVETPAVTAITPVPPPPAAP